MSMNVKRLCLCDFIVDKQHMQPCPRVSFERSKWPEIIEKHNTAFEKKESVS